MFFSFECHYILQEYNKKGNRKRYLFTKKLRTIDIVKQGEKKMLTNPKKYDILMHIEFILSKGDGK